MDVKMEPISDDDMRAPRHDTSVVNEAVQSALRDLFRGSLTAQIRAVVQQQTALVIGELANVQNAIPSALTNACSSTTMLADDSSERSRQSIILGEEIISRFDPDSSDSNVDLWLNKIDQHGDIHNWSEYDRGTIMKAKLRGAARNWYHRLDHYDLTWSQWKMKLRAAFPWRYNFAIQLEELVNRRKTQTESMTSYYRSKLELCTKIGVTGEKAVSCIIRGLPEELRTNAYATGCATPEALYDKFLSELDAYRGKTVAHEELDTYRGKTVAHEEPSSSRKPDSDRSPDRPLLEVKRKFLRCFNCQELGTHISKDCPKEKMDRCKRCGKGGHRRDDCKAKINRGVGDRRQIRPKFSRDRRR